MINHVRFWGVFILTALVWLSGCAGPRTVSETSDLTVYLVRHGEKMDDSRDPALSDAGIDRASALADRLSEANIDTIHSTDFLRTQATAAPLARRLGLTVQSYDPTNLQAVADGLIAHGGTHLVVGHSNTTPALVTALGGEAGPPIIEKTEYDRLYIVTRNGELTSTERSRYGGPNPN